MSFSLKSLRAHALGGLTQDLDIDGRITTMMLLFFMWWMGYVIRTGGEDLLGAFIAAGVGCAVMGFGSAMVAGVLEARDTMPKTWSDAIGFAVGGVLTVVSVSLWYPLWVAVPMVGLAQIIYWPAFLQTPRTLEAARPLELPEAVVAASLALPKGLEPGLRSKVEGALAVYGDLAQAVDALPTSERHFMADVEGTLLAIIAQARTLNSLGKRKSPTLDKARTTSRRKLEALLLGLDELLAAVALYDATQAADGLARLRERAEDLQHLAAAQVELDAL